MGGYLSQDTAIESGISFKLPCCHILFMIKLLLFFILTVALVNVNAQSNFNDSIARSRNRISENTMIVLGSWAVANMGAGLIIESNTSGETKYFWQMNGYWNAFNLGLANIAYVRARQAAARHFGFTENYKEQHAIEKLYVFNSGLDLAYIAGGFYLRERGKSESDFEKRSKLRGYGSSIAVQGGFLLLMDAIVFSLHRKNTRRMDRKLQKLEIEAGPGGLGINLSL